MRSLLTFTMATAAFTCLAPTAIAQEFLWQSEAPGGAGMLLPPAVGPDGTVYAVVGQSLRAVSPSGVELWSAPARDGQVSVGPDGTVYFAAPTGLRALRPDGSERWSLPLDDLIVAGPAVASDGTVYAVEDAQFGGLGMFRVNSDGEVLWNNAGSPLLTSHGGLPHAIAFSGDLAFVAMRTSRGIAPPYFWAFDSDGDLAYTLSTSCQGQPIVSPLTGDVVMGNGVCQSIVIHDAATGSLKETIAPPSTSPCRGLASIAIGPDGSIYTAFCHRAFWSVSATGDQRWFFDSFDQYFMMDRFAVVPDNSALLDLGWNPDTSVGRARAFSTADGSELWSIDLPDGATATTRPVFDGSRAYVNAHNSATQTNYLLAIDLGDCRADFDGDGALTIFDFLAFQNAFDAGDMAADFDEDGTLTIFDFLAFQNEFDSGC